jgi:tripartite-type tricarboxylate transporter receptor subunit TctC
LRNVKQIKNGDAMKTYRSTLTQCLAVLAIGSAAVGATAQTWPTGPVRMIAPQAAGGGPERVIRGLAQGLQNRLGQPVVVDYRPGAAGNIGTAELARSAPDGNTWMLGPENVLTINPLVYRTTGFNPPDVVPIRIVGTLHQVLACHPRVGVRSVAELAAAARARGLNYASSGPGSTAHLGMEVFLQEMRIDMNHVPYRGPAPAVQDLVGGQVDCAMLVASAIIEHVRSGRLVGLGVTGAERLPALPGVPTLREAGAASAGEASFSLVMFARRGVSAEILDKFGRVLDETLRSAELVEALAANNINPATTSGDLAGQELQRATQRWGVQIQRVQLRLD